jgi:hypothetical protein
MAWIIWPGPTAIAPPLAPAPDVTARIRVGLERGRPGAQCWIEPLNWNGRQAEGGNGQGFSQSRKPGKEKQWLCPGFPGFRLRGFG